MSEIDSIIKKARSLFDVACVYRLDSSETLMVLGLESTAERNLDDFGHDENGFHMYGFKKHAAPMLEELISYIHQVGFDAELFGTTGYPPQYKINVKEAVIRLGIGKRGKNTIVLHPVYGTRLRFMTIKTNAPFSLIEPVIQAEEENPACRDCTIGIDNCPVNVLEPYRMRDITRCLSNISPVDEKGHSILCDICLKLCPENKPVKQVK
jgi:epoxyqueuosine reductase QueG